MIKVEHANKTFFGKYGKVHALQDVSIHVEKGDIYGIIGFSGAGKSTLIRLVNGLETLDSGTVTVHGEELGSLKKPQLRKLRRKIGVVFQDYKLLPKLTVYENIAFALEVTGADTKDIRKRVIEVLEQVGLKHKAKSYPDKLSGGEQQRVAIARALAKNPKLLLCDEPTGALDYNTGKSILKLLQNMCREKGMTVIIITHDDEIANQVDRVVRIMDGKIVSDSVNP